MRSNFALRALKPAAPLPLPGAHGWHAAATGYPERGREVSRRPVPVSTMPGTRVRRPDTAEKPSTDRTRPAGGSTRMSEAVNAGAARMGRPARLPRRDGRRRPQGRVGAEAHDRPHRGGLERDLGRALRGLRRRPLGCRRRRGRRVVLRRLRDGEGAVARQRLRLHADLRRARRAARRAAARAALGHPDRARPARRVHLRRRRGARDLQLGRLAVRRAARLDRLADPARGGGARRGREARGTRAARASRASSRRSPRWSPSRSPT